MDSPVASSATTTQKETQPNNETTSGAAAAASSPACPSTSRPSSSALATQKDDSIENIDFAQLNRRSSTNSDLEQIDLSSSENELRRRRLERFESLSKTAQTQDEEIKED